MILKQLFEKGKGNLLRENVKLETVWSRGQTMSFFEFLLPPVADSTFRRHRQHDSKLHPPAGARRGSGQRRRIESVRGRSAEHHLRLRNVG
jgi:hypothetical protein